MIEVFIWCIFIEVGFAGDSWRYVF